MNINSIFLEKAKALEPVLFEKEMISTGTVKLVEDNSLRLGWRAIPEGTIQEFYERAFSQDDEIVLDFGEHLVGFLNLWYEAVDGEGDAPLRLKLTFGEVPCDTAIPAESFDGILGRGWVQTEIVTLDVIPGNVKLPRRYAFRYVKMKIEGLSPFYKVRFPKITATAITSADESKLVPLPDGTDPLLVEIDAAGARTLRDCMMSTVEDGPKRDRRYWTFDSGIGMKANYYTYHNDDMAKRLLYLQAAYTHEDGNTAACVYTSPEYKAGHEKMGEHASSFIGNLRDYVDGTGDEELLRELWPTAVCQMHVTAGHILENGLVDHKKFLGHWTNVDKQMFAQCYVIRRLRDYEVLAERLGDNVEAEFAREKAEIIINAARRELYDEKIGLYVSGENREVSWRSQICAAASGIEPKENVKALFERAEKYPDCRGIQSTTTYALYIQALIDCDIKEKALEVIKDYFGAQLREGGTTFFEHFNFDWIFACPYRHIIVDSYCHSCQAIASYFIRKYFI